MKDSAHTATGFVETRGLVAALEAADAMCKASDVRLVRMERTVAALVTVIVEGETAAVRSSVDAGAAAAERVGELVSSHVIARPDEQTRRMQSSGSAPGLEAMTVHELRALARTREDLPIQGREIARANKAELLRVLSS
ncbi:MAG: ethanolamine utilization protein EutM [Bacteroidetes bacterium CG12_big_fil_rev_8_21_14_0_65_60_17]|nr:MAG: ethanolamine utilization protein EutM [Bacteroidetes bacterium CG12_big_fil_rev_8_21_14_0_65_60_17]